MDESLIECFFCPSLLIVLNPLANRVREFSEIVGCGGIEVCSSMTCLALALALPLPPAPVGRRRGGAAQAGPGCS